MNSRIIILAAAVLSLASCSTAYRTGQTPDDVYYSPVRERDEYVVVDRNDNRRYNNDDRYYYNSDDNYLRMMSRNRYRWSAFNDYYWMDSRPFIGFNTGWSYNPIYNPWSFNGFYPNYWTWNNWYNPYGHHYVVVNPVKNPNVYSRLKTFNTGSYTNPNYSNTNSRRYGNFSKGTVRPTYNNSNSNRNNNQLGTSIKKVFSNPDRQYNNNSSYDRPVRTYNPSNSNTNSYSPSRSSSSSSSSSSSGSSGGGGSTGSRPGRGN